MVKQNIVYAENSSDALCRVKFHGDSVYVKEVSDKKFYIIVKYKLTDLLRWKINSLACQFGYVICKLRRI